MAFPQNRPRRMRRNAQIRRMVRETTLSVDDLIMPLFVRSGKNTRKPINSMPGNFQMSPDLIAAECQEIHKLGIPAVILFGIPDTKDAVGSSGYAKNAQPRYRIRALSCHSAERE